MQRVRTSLPYFRKFGWEAELVVVDEQYVDMSRDVLLLESVPTDIPIHKVGAFDKKLTSKFGLGSIALRSLYFFKKKVNKLLRTKEFDLIYFSTTQFPVCVLGPYWKKKFNIPYVIDMQDPWHSDYYQGKPKNERPKKYWFSYRMNKRLEAIAMRNVDGIISVSEVYIKTLKERYPNVVDKPCKAITFGAFERDFDIAAQHDSNLELAYHLSNDRINIVYIGRGGFDMADTLSILFKNFKKGLEEDKDLFNNVCLHFIGTSYAPKGEGAQTIFPLAKKMGIEQFVREETDRITYYESLKNLKNADGLLIIGSNDKAYTASKIFPYILAKKPLLAIFDANSSTHVIIETCNAGDIINLDDNLSKAYSTLKNYILKVKNKQVQATNWKEFENYTASHLTSAQVNLFNDVLKTNRR